MIKQTTMGQRPLGPEGGSQGKPSKDSTEKEGPASRDLDQDAVPSITFAFSLSLSHTHTQTQSNKLSQCLRGNGDKGEKEISSRDLDTCEFSGASQPRSESLHRRGHPQPHVKSWQELCQGWHLHPLLQRRRQRFREVKFLAGGHKARRNGPRMSILLDPTSLRHGTRQR